MRRHDVVLVLALLVLAIAVLPMYAQQAGAGRPKTYSFEQTAAMAGSAIIVKVARDGDRETIDQTKAPSAMGEGMNIRALYDFAAHKVYTLDLKNRTCTVVAYTSPGPPAMWDPIGGDDETAAQVAKEKPAVLRTETLNGIVTKVFEAPGPEGGKVRLWLEEKLLFPVKMMMIGKDRKEQVMIEMRNLSYAKPPADLFTPPATCQAVAGETNATGGHVEMQAGAQAGGQEAMQGKANERPAAPVAPAPAATPGQVTAVRSLGVRPNANYKGPYPGKFEFVFSVTTDGPAEVKWALANHGGGNWENGAVTFTAAGTKEVRVPIKVGLPGQVWQGWAKLEVYEPNKVVSQQVNISADCRVP